MDLNLECLSDVRRRTSQAADGWFQEGGGGKKKEKKGVMKNIQVYLTSLPGKIANTGTVLRSVS